MKKSFKINGVDDNIIALFSSEAKLMKCKNNAEFFSHILNSWCEMKAKQEKNLQHIIQRPTSEDEAELNK